MKNLWKNDFETLKSILEKITNAQDREKFQRSLDKIRIYFDSDLNIDAEMSLNIQEVAKIGGWSFDLKTGQQVWSSEHYKIFEIPEPQDQTELYRLYRQRIHPEDLPRLDKIIEKTKNLGGDFVYEHRVVLDQGARVKYVRGIGKVIKNSNGEPQSIIGTCQDVTDFKRIEVQTQLAFDTLGIGVWRYNTQTRELSWDESMYRLFEVDKSEFSGDYEAWEKLLSPEAKASAVNDLDLAIQGKKEFNTTFAIGLKDGRKKSIGGRGVVLRDSQGRPNMMIGINWDRTKELEMEKGLELEKTKSIHNSRLAALGQLSAGVAHEINNPLAIITASLTQLEKYRGDDIKFKNKISAIEQASGRIEKIVKGLRKFSRQSDEHQRELLSLKDIILETLSMVEPTAQKERIQVQTHLLDNVKIFADPVEIGQVLINLLNNAIFIAQNREQKWIRIEMFDEEKGFGIRVIDPGEGIPEDILEKIFHPFFTTKPIGEGTGLGLSISRGIIEDHAGHLDLNKQFSNTCFEIRFDK